MRIPKSIFSDRNILIFYLILMNVHFWYFEGAPFSWLKNVFMVVSIPIFIARCAYFSKAVIIGLCFWLSMILSAMFHPETFRFSTLGYSGMLLITYMMFYNLLYKGSMTLATFNKLIRCLIFSFVLCHVAQQLSLLVGIRFMPIINLSNQHFLAIDKLPSFTLEPSVFARVMGVLMYSYLKGQEYSQGHVLSIGQIISREHRWIFIGFFWSMFTMGSGTAFIVMGVLSLYFVRRQYLYWFVPLLFFISLSAPYLHIKQLDRAVLVVSTTLALDAELVNKTDGSAASRINPVLNTLNDLDLTTTEGWFGKGIDSTKNNLRRTGKLDGIDDFGFINYLLGLLLVFSCSIDFFSIPTIMYIIGIGGTTANITYCWGLLLLFMCTRYFGSLENTGDREPIQLS